MNEARKMMLLEWEDDPFYKQIVRRDLRGCTLVLVKLAYPFPEPDKKYLASGAVSWCKIPSKRFTNPEDAKAYIDAKLIELGYRTVSANIKVLL